MNDGRTNLSLIGRATLQELRYWTKNMSAQQCLYNIVIYSRHGHVHVGQEQLVRGCGSGVSGLRTSEENKARISEISRLDKAGILGKFK
jgi:hypothetical protein